VSTQYEVTARALYAARHSFRTGVQGILAAGGAIHRERSKKGLRSSHRIVLSERQVKNLLLEREWRMSPRAA